VLTVVGTVLTVGIASTVVSWRGLVTLLRRPATSTAAG
jgi:hypothetical protein